MVKLGIIESAARSEGYFIERDIDFLTPELNHESNNYLSLNLDPSRSSSKRDLVKLKLFIPNSFGVLCDFAILFNNGKGDYSGLELGSQLSLAGPKLLDSRILAGFSENLPTLRGAFRTHYNLKIGERCTPLDSRVFADLNFSHSSTLPALEAIQALREAYASLDQMFKA